MPSKNLCLKSIQLILIFSLRVAPNWTIAALFAKCRRRPIKSGRCFYIPLSLDDKWLSQELYSKTQRSQRLGSDNRSADCETKHQVKTVTWHQIESTDNGKLQYNLEEECWDIGGTRREYYHVEVISQLFMMQIYIWPIRMLSIYRGPPSSSNAWY